MSCRNRYHLIPLSALLAAASPAALAQQGAAAETEDRIADTKYNVSAAWTRNNSPEQH
jgi:hypothetical protein